MSLRFDFRDVPLLIGTDDAGRGRCIGLISGTCEISGPPHAWDLDNVVLTAPLFGQPDVEIKWVPDRLPYRRERFMWDIVATSIEDACASAIYDALLEQQARKIPAPLAD